MYQNQGKIECQKWLVELLTKIGIEIEELLALGSRWKGLKVLWESLAMLQQELDARLESQMFVPPSISAHIDRVPFEAVPIVQQHRLNHYAQS